MTMEQTFSASSVVTSRPADPLPIDPRLVEPRLVDVSGESPGDATPVDILFVPTHENGGTGEYYATLALALALRRRRPDVRIAFLLQADPRMRQDVPFRRFMHQGEPAAKHDFYAAMIARLRPQVALFNTTCRTSALRACRRHGVRSAVITNNRGSLRKAFRLDWLLLLDHHWHQRYLVTQPVFSPMQRWLARFSPVERLLYDTMYADAQGEAADLPPQVAERLRKPFALFIPGGGGYKLDGRPAAEVFLEAAEAFHRATGMEALTLLGGFHQPVLAEQRTMGLAEVSQATLMELLRRATVAVTSGGSCLHQALHCGAGVVSAVVGGGDQAERIAEYAANGLVLSSPARSADLAQAAARLVREPELSRQLRQRCSAYSFVNGIPLMADTLSQMIHATAPEALRAPVRA
jgi:hypothetical protein